MGAKKRGTGWPIWVAAGIFLIGGYVASYFVCMDMIYFAPDAKNGRPAHKIPFCEFSERIDGVLTVVFGPVNRIDIMLRPEIWAL